MTEITNYLTQNLTTINVQITPILLLKLGGGGTIVAFIIKYSMDGTFWKWLAGVWKYANRKYAESSITASIKNLRKGKTLGDFEEDLGKKIKYEIQNNLHLEDLSEGETVLIALDSARNTPSNLTRATLQYVSKSLLPKASMTLNPNLEKGVTYVVCREALSNQNMISARDYFDSKILPEEYSNNPGFESLMESLRKVQRFGLLTKVILQQFVELNKLTFETFEYSKIKQETNNFVEFIKAITERQEQQNSNLKFKGDFIKVRIILVSSSHQLDMGGVPHLLNRINSQQEFDYIYLVCPAINRDLVGIRGAGKKDQFWGVYNQTLKDLKDGSQRFTLRKSQTVKAKNKSNETVKIGISFLSRNY